MLLKMRKISVAFIIMCALLLAIVPLSGCKQVQIKGETEYEKAVHLCEATTSTFYMLRDTYNAMLVSFPNHEHALKNTIAPKLNELQGAVVAWRGVMLLWGQLKAKPAEYPYIEQNAIEILSIVSDEMNILQGRDTRVHKGEY